MDERVIYLLKQYAAHRLTDAEASELKEYMADSDDNRNRVRTFAMLRRAGMQAGVAGGISAERGWMSIEAGIRRRHRRALMTRMAAVGAVLIMACAGFLFLNRHDDAPALARMMQTEAINRAVITLPDNTTLAVDGGDSVSVVDASGQVICENNRGNLTYYAALPAPIYNKVKVEEGSNIRLTLCDGTCITLASGSELTYPIGGGMRDVTLSGEAYFEVAPDRSNPFTVNCPDGVTVTVLGTTFNVSAYKGAPIAVTLATGIIRLNTPTEYMTLAPGDHAVVTTGGKTKVTMVKPELYTSWARGIYEFDNASLDEITHELTLWYGIDFEFADRTLADRKFTGVLLRDRNLSYSLGLLGDVSAISFRAEDGRIVIDSEL
ncbi:MAG: FecR domain-containing protein [Duncaniella sp.]|nr:FecR domain-containing protein [Duncaniella sp.]